jgi:hypothetical protein
MLQSHDVQAFLNQFEALKQVDVRPESEIIDAPWLVKLSGSVLLYGEPHYFESNLDLRQFGGVNDLMKLVEQLLKTFAAASEKVKLGQ